METIRIINFIITAIFAVCYSYQFIYVPISLWMQHREKKAAKTSSSSDSELCARNLKRYAVLICARNEENVIGDLIGGIMRRTFNCYLLDLKPFFERKNTDPEQQNDDERNDKFGQIVFEDHFNT